MAIIDLYNGFGSQQLAVTIALNCAGTAKELIAGCTNKQLDDLANQYFPKSEYFPDHEDFYLDGGTFNHLQRALVQHILSSRTKGITTNAHIVVCIEYFKHYSQKRPSSVFTKCLEYGNLNEWDVMYKFGDMYLFNAGGGGQLTDYTWQYCEPEKAAIWTEIPLPNLQKELTILETPMPIKTRWNYEYKDNRNPFEVGQVTVENDKKYL